MEEPSPESLLEEIRLRTGPIEDHLEALATSEELPSFAIGICTLRFDESAPALRAVLERAAAGEALDRAESNLLFCAVHILGGHRDAQSFAPMLRFLCRPGPEVDRLLDYAITETVSGIVAGVFDGNAEALFDAIANPNAAQYVRDAIFGATTFLTWEGRIARASMQAFLERFFNDRLAEDGDFAWHGWQEAVALLGLRPLEPLARRAWAEGRMPERFQSFEHFQRNLAEAERKPDDIRRFERANLGYIEDVLEAIERFAWDDGTDADDPIFDEDDDEDDEPAGEPWIEPAINPWRNVGRNDLCPCGSGRKFKKCCLGSEEGEPFDG